MAIAPTKRDARVEVCSIEELQADGNRVLSVEGRSVLVLLDQGRLYALDNRCPHMGFPLHRGTVKDGILTCHWHHSKFDLAGGCTFDPFADDVTSFHVELRDGSVWLDPTPIEEDPSSHWRRKLDEGLKHNISIVQAKSVIGMAGLGATNQVVEETALFGIRNRAAGWSPGLSILTSMANILPYLDADDRPLALYYGVVHVAAGTAGQPPSFDLAPLETLEKSPERYMDWFPGICRGAVWGRRGARAPHRHPDQPA
jgi:nitrite reductase/ring-hydroxylating ferredoxin subunit